MIKNNKGFTIIELLVAVAIFSVVVSVAAGGFVNALKTQRQTAALISANSNASLAIEQIAREIRTGSDFCVNGQNCPSANTLSFKNAQGDTVTYCLSGSAILRGVGGGSCGSIGFQKITADNVVVQYLDFYLMGQNANDGLQPRITIAVGVSSNEVGVSGSIVNLETTVSSRLPIDS